MKININKYYNTICVALILSIVPLFILLDSWAIRIWDESRNMIQAIEMYHHHNWLVPSYQGDTDMWNTKPPLLIWIQVFLFSLFKPSIFLARLPSALSGFLILVTIYVFYKRVFKKDLIGLLAILFLISTPAIIRYHVTRTADYDALLTLFMLAYLLYFFVYFNTNKNKYLLLFFLFLTLATLTKGIAAFFFLPSIFIFCLINKRIVSIIKNKTFYIGLFSFISIVLFYYLLREQINKGYLEAVWNNELFGRYAMTNEGHHGNFLYYANYFINVYFKPYYLFFLIAIPVLLSSKNKVERKFYQYIILNIFIFFLIISISKTKIEWYDAPMYPLIAICCAALLYKLLNAIHNSFQINGLRTGIIIALFLLPYINFNISLYKMVKEQVYNNEHINSYFMHRSLKNPAKIDGLYLENLVNNNYDAATYYYKYYLKAEKKISVHTLNYNDTLSIKENSKVATANESTKNFIQQHYNYTALDSLGLLHVYLIGNKVH